MLVRFGAFLSYLLVGSAVAAQDVNARIRAELEQIHTLDQRDRLNVGNYTTGPQKDSVIAHMVAQDSLGLLRVTAILDSAGWLGVEEIGHKANQALFLVIQHADARPEVQAEYLLMMREAVANGRARPHELAMLEDRVAVNHGRPQIYGSQIGWKDGKGFVKPIEDEEHVNERRKAVGLEPLERYAERFGLVWSPPVARERVLLFQGTH
jgi:hypothetical protein